MVGGPEWPLVGRDDELALLRRALRSDPPRGAILSGPPGVGKSRLAAHVAREAQGNGWSRLALRGSAGLATIPFGALRAVLDLNAAPAGLPELAQLLRSALDAAAMDAPLLLVVDDAHLLDEASAGMLHARVASDDTVLIATVRAGVPRPDALTALWKDGLVERLDLRELSRLDSAELTRAALGGEVEDTTLERLWRIAAGNPLYLREVILSSLETGALSNTGGQWRWRGAWAGTERLHEIVSERLGRLAALELTAVEALAAGGPLPLDLVVEMTSRETLASLESRGLVTVAETGTGPEVALSHPVHAEVMRSTMPKLQTRAVLGSLTEAISRTSDHRPEDQIRRARWALEAGLPVDPVTLRRAAESGLWHVGEAIAANIRGVMPSLADATLPSQYKTMKPEEAVRLARAAWESGGSTDDGVSLAVALAFTGNTVEAEAVLDTLRTMTGDPDDRLRIAQALSSAQFWGQRRPDAAIATLAAAIDAAPASASIELIAELLRVWAGIEVNVGHPRAALDLAERSAVVLGVDMERAPAAIVKAAALVFLGRCQDVLELVNEALPHTLAGGHPLSAAELMISRAGSLARAGNLQEARELCESCRQIALSADSLDGTAIYGIVAAEVMLKEGRPAPATRLFRDSVGLLSEQDALGYLPWALSGLSRAQAMRGDAVGSARTLEAAEAASVLPRYFDVGLVLARSAVHAVHGRREEAIAAACEASQWAADAGMVVDEAWAVDTWLRLKPSGELAARLQLLSGQTDSPFVALLARHADAFVGRDPVGLLESADAFAAMTAWLMAAEAAVAAADCYTSAHGRRDAERATRRAAEFAARCEGARSPMLDRIGAPSTLTRRELEVARLAAAGVTSKAIAQRLKVSARTVEAHLYHAYVKLGVSDRTGLSEHLGSEGPTEFGSA